MQALYCGSLLGLLSSWSMWAPEYMTFVVVTTGLDALQHVGS